MPFVFLPEHRPVWWHSRGHNGRQSSLECTTCGGFGNPPQVCEQPLSPELLGDELLLVPLLHPHQETPRWKASQVLARFCVWVSLRGCSWARPVHLSSPMVVGLVGNSNSMFDQNWRLTDYEIFFGRRRAPPKTGHGIGWDGPKAGGDLAYCWCLVRCHICVPNAMPVSSHGPSWSSCRKPRTVHLFTTISNELNDKCIYSIETNKHKVGMPFATNRC